MKRAWLCRGGVVVAVLFALSPVLAGADRGKAGRLETFQGKVRPLSEVLAKSGVQLDADAAPVWLALVTDGGKVYPLIKDSGARPFFKDKALLNRPVQLTGQLVAGGGLLQVGTYHGLVKGELHDLYYWCDICSIRRAEKNACECCGGPMELREEKAR